MRWYGKGSESGTRLRIRHNFYLARYPKLNEWNRSLPYKFECQLDHSYVPRGTETRQTTPAFLITITTSVTPKKLTALLKPSCVIDQHPSGKYWWDVRKHGKVIGIKAMEGSLGKVLKPGDQVIVLVNLSEAEAKQYGLKPSTAPDKRKDPKPWSKRKQNDKWRREAKKSTAKYRKKQEDKWMQDELDCCSEEPREEKILVEKFDLSAVQG